jgi:hypothetical protein
MASLRHAAGCWRSRGVRGIAMVSCLVVANIRPPGVGERAGHPAPPRDVR